MIFLAQSEGMGWFGWLWMMLLLGLGLFMILLVLLQRGRGGGLVGALGGAGGQSAFGTRAGDVFTKITIVVATLWVATAGIGGIALRSAATSASSSVISGQSDGAADPLATPAGLETADPIDLGELGTADDAAAPAAGDDESIAAPALPAPGGDAADADAAAPAESTDGSGGTASGGAAAEPAAESSGE